MTKQRRDRDGGITFSISRTKRVGKGDCSRGCVGAYRRVDANSEGVTSRGSASGSRV